MDPQTQNQILPKTLWENKNAAGNTENIIYPTNRSLILYSSCKEGPEKIFYSMKTLSPR